MIKFATIIAAVLISSFALAQQPTDDEIKQAWEACTLHYELPPNQAKAKAWHTPTKFVAGWEGCTIIGEEFTKRTEAQTEEIKKKNLENMIKKIK